MIVKIKEYEYRARCTDSVVLQKVPHMEIIVRQIFMNNGDVISSIIPDKPGKRGLK